MGVSMGLVVSFRGKQKEGFYHMVEIILITHIIIFMLINLCIKGIFNIYNSHFTIHFQYKTIGKRIYGNIYIDHFNKIFTTKQCSNKFIN